MICCEERTRRGNKNRTQKTPTTRTTRRRFSSNVKLRVSVHIDIVRNFRPLQKGYDDKGVMGTGGAFPPGPKFFRRHKKN